MNKVLIIASFPKSLVHFRGELLKTLVSRNNQVFVAAPNIYKDNTISNTLINWGLNLCNIKLDRTGTNPLLDIITFISILYVVIINRPTHIVAYTIKPIIYGLIAGKVVGVKNRHALITGLGYAFAENSQMSNNFIKKIAMYLYRISLKGSKNIFFQNPDDLELFKKLNIIPDDSNFSVVNGSGVDTKHYYMVNRKKSVIKFLMISRLLRDKGVIEFLESASNLKKKYTSVQFILVGDIDTNPSSLQMSEIRKYISDGIIDYRGYIDDVRDVIAECSVFVLPSYREGTPRSVLEAMSMGTPIITTNAPGCRETVIDGVNGYLIEPKSTTSLIDAMIKFIINPCIIDSMSIASREIAVNKYCVKNVNEYMIKCMKL